MWSLNRLKKFLKNKMLFLFNKLQKKSKILMIVYRLTVIKFLIGLLLVISTFTFLQYKDSIDFIKDIDKKKKPEGEYWLLKTFINFQKSIEIRGRRRKLYIQMMKKRLISNIFKKKLITIKIHLNMLDKIKVSI